MGETNSQRLERCKTFANADDINWIIDQAEQLQEIKKVMGLSHADSFNIGETIDEIRNILEFN